MFLKVAEMLQKLSGMMNEDLEWSLIHDSQQKQVQPGTILDKTLGASFRATEKIASQKLPQTNT